MSELKTIQPEEQAALSAIVKGKAKEVSWRNKRFVVRQFLEVNEYADMVKSVIDGCIDSSGSLSTFIPDYLFKAAVVSYYSTVQLPESFDDSFRLIYMTDLYNVVYCNACSDQIDAAKATVDLFMR